MRKHITSLFIIFFSFLSLFLFSSNSVQAISDCSLKGTGLDCGPYTGFAGGAEACTQNNGASQTVCCPSGTKADLATKSCKVPIAPVPPGAAPAAGDNIFGSIEPPPGVKSFNDQAAVNGGSGIGIIIFVSNMIKLFTIIAGVIVLFNFILAGFTYITSPGDSSSQNKMRDQITYSVLGLVIIVAAYTIIAVLSLIIFGQADYILNPQLVGPTP